ncbi:MAG: hypothetical protein FWH24_04445 [Oscillospiraceae bacterium]|nr:hypothetical protein [Oscillospiraceae bacterium]
MYEGNSFGNKIKTFVKNIRGTAVTAAVLCAVVILFIIAVNGASDKADASAAAVLESAVRRAAVQCYAIEGFYPVGLDYLVENYGLIIDESKFSVHYAAYMPNYMPVIQVKRFGADDIVIDEEE